MSHDHDHLHPRRSDGSESTPLPLGPRAWWKEPGDPPGVWDNSTNVSRLLNVFYLLCVIVLVLDLVIHRHIYHTWEGIFGFHAWYGFASFWILVALAKRMRKVLMRSEDYYDVD